jgi:hypothetical protein
MPRSVILVSYAGLPSWIRGATTIRNVALRSTRAHAINFLHDRLPATRRYDVQQYGQNPGFTPLCPRTLLDTSRLRFKFEFWKVDKFLLPLLYVFSSEQGKLAIAVFFQDPSKCKKGNCHGKTEHALKSFN